MKKVLGPRYWRALFLAAVPAVALLAFVYAYNLTWNAPVSLVVTDPDVKVYWDANCTDPVTSLDYGSLQRGQSRSIILYIKNVGLGPCRVYWNSTLSYVTTRITDTWQTSTGYNINGTYIVAGASLYTVYRIIVSSDAPSASYSWTLYLGADPS